MNIHPFIFYRGVSGRARGGCWSLWQVTLGEDRSPVYYKERQTTTHTHTHIHTSGQFTLTSSSKPRCMSFYGGRKSEESEGAQTQTREEPTEATSQSDAEMGGSCLRHPSGKKTFVLLSVRRSVVTAADLCVLCGLLRADTALSSVPQLVHHPAQQ